MSATASAQSSLGTSPTPNPSTPRSQHRVPSTEFTFTFTPSTGGGPTPSSSRSGTTGRGSETGASPSIPVQVRESTTSTRTLFAAADIEPGPGRQNHEASAAHRGNIPSNGLSPGPSSTYRNLYNATPSPQPRSAEAITRGAALEAVSPLASCVGSMSSGVRDLRVRSGSEDEIRSVEGDTYDEDESDDESVYNVRQEELPRAPIYNVRLQEALREVRGELTQLSDTMGRSELARDDESNLHALYRQIELMSRFECPETRTVGFIGNSGAGKSTLINSLLDQEGLARSSGDGAACTCVVTEFRNVDETHPGPYTIEVDYMSTDEITELLEELLRSYRRRYTEIFWEVTGNDEREAIIASAELALKTLESMFPDRRGSELNHEFLSNDAPDAEHTIVSRLRDWAMAGLDHRPGGPDNLQYRVTVQRIRECKEILGMFTVDSGSQERPAIWPFVKLIRVYLRSRILRTGLVLADMPGFRDLNYAREQATERYLRNSCDEVFIVSEITRVSTEPSVKDTAQRRVRRDQPLRIVCTKSEDVDPTETPRDAADFRQIQQLLREREETRRAIRRTSSRRRRAAGSRAGDYANEVVDLQEERERIELQLQRLSINRRNETVTRSLLREYPNAKIFCVSNTLYRDQREENGQYAGDYIELSGIPVLRQYCQSVPAEAQLRATSAFLENRVPAILGSLNQWSLAGSDAVTVDRAETLRRALTNGQDTIREHLASRNSCTRPAQRSLATQFNASIIRTSRNSRERWTIEAVRVCQGWSTMHHSSYSAFCRKYGVHTVGSGPPRCWNEEVLERATEELSRGWDTVLESLAQQLESVDSQVSDIFHSVCVLLEEHTHLAPQALENLIDNMDAQQRCVMDAIERSFEELQQRTVQTKLDTIDGHATSYIAQIMRPAYNECMAESGRGSDARRKSIMDRYIRNSQVFLRFTNQIQADYIGILDESFTELRENLEGEVRNIIQDLGTAITVEGEVTEAGRFPALTEQLREKVSQVQQCVTEAQRIIRGLQGRQ